MIYVLTIHWERPDWIDIQLKYLNKYITEPHKKFTFLNIPTNKYDNQFDYVSHENIKRHASKLNILADMACFDSLDDNDLLLFIDGDAFPINDFLPSIRSSLMDHKLVAVERKENLGDCQPHPCFCITTVGFWKNYNLDWNPGGAYWHDLNEKKITDLGGKILKILNDNGLKWKSLLRSNKRNPHPLHYGVYEDMVYHHGAGFRNPATRTDLNIANRRKIRTKLYHFLSKFLPHQLNKKLFRPMNKVVKQNKKMSSAVFDYINADPQFYNYFLGKDEACDTDKAANLIEKFEKIS